MPSIQDVENLLIFDISFAGVCFISIFEENMSTNWGINYRCIINVVTIQKTGK